MSGARFMAAVVVAMALLAAPLGAQTTAAAGAETLRIAALDLRHVDQDFGRPRRDQSVDRQPLSIGGTAFAHGLGTHANSTLWIDLKGAATRFDAMVGVDDEVGRNGSVVFAVSVDGKEAFRSPVMHGGEAARPVDIAVTGAKILMLHVTDAGDGINFDHADWANAALTLAAGAAARPVATDEPLDASAMTTPQIAHGDPDAPAIHGPRVVGTTPGRPFLFLVPATGKGRLTYSATGLPPGLTLDRATGIITGMAAAAGESTVTLQVSGEAGTATRALRIVAGEHQLALTPPMGWNSWNVWAGAVSQDKVKAAADALVRSGLAAKGYAYINIDDTWEGKERDPQTGEITTNERFPDMKALADYVHARGLKLGIYSSPGPKTCGGYLGSYEHEAQDARTYARWGIDYLKYDWCSYGQVAGGNDLPALQKPYIVMRRALDAADRDIVYSLCQYGMGDVATWGGSAEVGGNLWRTTGDINDSWRSLAGIAFGQGKNAPHAGPGHWNDPDMLVVGKVGWGPRLHPTGLRPNEQLLHITMWSMLAAPLLIGCDLDDMDTFTHDLLTNAEVLDVDQDPLGQAARRVGTTGEVWARPLFDGSVAVALCNRSAAQAKVAVAWTQIADLWPENMRQTDGHAVRDLWRQKDLGVMEKGYETLVPAHGAVLVKIGGPQE